MVTIDTFVSTDGKDHSFQLNMCDQITDIALHVNTMDVGIFWTQSGHV